VIGAAQSLFWLSQGPGWLRFKRQLDHPQAVQESLLARLLKANAGTEWGRKFGFASIRTSAQYQAQVPLCTYGDLEEAIQRMRHGAVDVLFPGQADLFEPSGGSTAGPRLIPYNQCLAREFRAGLAPWIFDLYRRHPGLLGGKAYWAITPAGGLKDGGEGFASDAAYFGGALERLSGAFLAVPPSVAGLKDMQAFRLRTLEHLCRARSLRFISVWNPSFLTLLLADLPRVRSRSPAELWPDLKLISCWADGHAAAAVPAMQALFPGVEIQPKGLMATEAVVSLPFEGRHPLSLGSHFFEFLDGDDKPHRAWELADGRRYSVVVTTGGGLYRYRLRDRIEVQGFLGPTPCLRFLGKEDLVSDTCGEKLEEGFVSAALRRAAGSLDLRPAFNLLSPERRGSSFAYVLYHEGAGAEGFAAALERELCANFHYEYCRRLGQLGPVRVQALPPGSAQRYLHNRAALGQRLGSVKALALDPALDAGGAFA
jgi:hypothetical protein